MAHDKVDKWPDWAKWLAKDEDGTWWYFEKRPECGDACWHALDGTFAEAKTYWRNSLTQRPQE